MTELNIEQFSPTVAEIQALVQEASVITADNTPEVRRVRLLLKNQRVRIEKAGKEFRAAAIKFQKDVIAKEKELVAMIEPQEERLEAIEKEEAKKKLREERVALLPERWGKIDTIGHPNGRGNITEEVLLDLDAVAFQEVLNNIVADKNRIEQEKIDAERQRLAEENARLQRGKEMAEAQEKARQEERERAERVAREEKERQERLLREEREAGERRLREEKEATERREKERLEREAKEKAEAEEKAKQEAIRKEQERKATENSEAYKAFMGKHGLLEVTKEELAKWFVMNDNSDPAHPKVKLYKLVDVLELKP